MTKPNQELLMAYVDGELNHQDRRTVEMAMDVDRDVRMKIEQYRKTRTAIDHFGDILSEPIPDHLAKTIHAHKAPVPQTTKVNWLALAASLAIGLFMGAGASHFTRSDAPTQTAEQGKTIVELRDQLEKTESARKILETRLQSAMQKQRSANRTADIIPIVTIALALSNGAKLSEQQIVTILSEVATKIDESTQEKNRDNLTTKASQYESLDALQPGGLPTPETLSSPKPEDTGPTIKIIGEFAYASADCLLVEFGSKRLKVLACRTPLENWHIRHTN